MSDRWQAVLTTLRERFAPDADVGEIAAYLSSEGYDRRQIGEIVACFRADRGQPVETGGAARGHPPAIAGDDRRLPPLRVRGPHEAERFTPQAWGELLALQASGMLTILELERVIEHTLDHTEGRLDLAELRTILDGIGLGGAGGSGHPVTIH